MKKLLALFVMATISLVAQAQLGLLVKDFTPGTVVFTDGHEESFPLVQLPGTTAKSLDVYTTEKKSSSSKQTFQPEQIHSVKVWAPDFPDKVYTIYCLRAEKLLTLARYQWGVPMAASEWGVVFLCHAGYDVDNKTGEFITKVVYTDNTENPAVGLLMIHGEDEGRWVIQRYSWGKTQWIDLTGKRMMKAVASNQEVVQQIKKKKLKPADIQYILDKMAAGE